MAFIRADSHSVPVTFPLGANGYAIVSSTTLSLRFQFREDALYVEEEVFDNDSGILLHAIGQLHSTNDAGMFWSLKPGKYRAYGLPDSVMPASTKILTPRQSSTVSIDPFVPIQVKVEPDHHTIHNLSDDSDSEDVLVSDSNLFETSTPVQPSALAFIRADDHPVPVTFPVGPAGYATVSERSLALQFLFKKESVHIEEEIFEFKSPQASQSIGQLSFRNDDGKVWFLKPGKFRAYGISISLMDASTELLTSRESSMSSVQTPSLRKVKIEPGLRTIYELRDSCPLPNVDVSHMFEKCSTKYLPKDPDSQPTSNSTGNSTSKSTSVIDSLKQLASRKRSKNVLSKIDYDTITIERVEYLPPTFDGDIIFEFPPLGCHARQTVAKQLRGMDKRFDGHAWTRTITSNISNDFGLTFRTSSCLGHLRCDNVDCEFLTRVHRTTPINETEWEGNSSLPFECGTVPPKDSTIVCSICKVSPSCVALCPARIYYVVGSESMTRACIHFGIHAHPVKTGDYRDSIEHTTSFLSEQIQSTPTATNSALVLEASKDLVGDMLLAPEGSQPKSLSVDDLLPLFDRCKHLTSPSIRNTVSGFKYIRRFGVMDSITKLRGSSNWPYVQENKFPGQGAETDKVFVFKMSEVGPGSGVDLVKRMQAGGDLENAWLMFDHVKRVQSWTTMACHVYDATFCRVMTIAVCDMQSEDTAAQIVVWKNLNAVMARHNVSQPNFKGFMADSAQANWNAIRIVYGNGDASMPMENKERTCLFHWTQSLEKHTKAYIRLDLQDQHRLLCKQYKNAKTISEAEMRYLAIRAWWLSSGAASEDAISRLDLWLAFWHFRYRQWGGFMQLVSSSLIERVPIH